MVLPTALLDKAPASAKSAFSKAFDMGKGGGTVATEPVNLGMFYKVDPNDWFKTYPFYFQFETENPKTTVTFYLPIPPQQMTVQQVSAAEAHATIGGVVEEVSAPVFYMVNLAGTTGMSLNAVGVSTPGSDVKGRQTFESLSGTDSVAGRLAGSVAKNIESIANLVTPEENVPFFKYGSAVNTLTEAKPTSENWENLASTEKSESPTATQAIGKMLGKVARSLIGNTSDNKQPSWYLNGFTWDHALRQFFLIYQRERAKGSVGQLYFIDAKSNNKYACVPKNVQFHKSANLPYISQYQIALKCWSGQNNGSLGIDGEKAGPVDRFSGDLAEVYTVSAGALVSSIKKTMLKFNRIKDVAGAMVRDAGGSTFG